jgi:hypothetical protein
MEMEPDMAAVSIRDLDDSVKEASVPPGTGGRWRPKCGQF